MPQSIHSPDMLALLRYLDAVDKAIRVAGQHDRAGDIRRVIDAVNAGAHLLFMEDEDPAARCQARTTAPTGEE